MKLNSKTIEARLIRTSRVTIFSALAFSAIATVLLLTRYSSWLIVGLVFTTGAVLFLVSMVMPGVLIIIKRPNLAYAWRNGRYPLAFSDITWELLSTNQRRSVYVESMFSLLIVIVFVVWFVSEQ